MVENWILGAVEQILSAFEMRWVERLVFWAWVAIARSLVFLWVFSGSFGFQCSVYSVSYNSRNNSCSNFIVQENRVEIGSAIFKYSLSHFKSLISSFLKMRNFRHSQRGEMELTNLGRKGGGETYDTRFWVHSRSRFTSLASCIPSANLARDLARRAWALAWSSKISRCLALSFPDLCGASCQRGSFF